MNLKTIYAFNSFNKLINYIFNIGNMCSILLTRFTRRTFICDSKSEFLQKNMRD